MSRFGNNPFYNPAEKSFYKFNPTSLTWVNARRAAWDQGGALVSLSNRAEGRWLWQNVISSSSRPQQNRRHEDYWIGLTIQNTLIGATTGERGIGVGLMDHVGITMMFVTVEIILVGVGMRENQPTGVVGIRLLQLGIHGIAE